MFAVFRPNDLGDRNATVKRKHALSFLPSLGVCFFTPCSEQIFLHLFEVYTLRLTPLGRYAVMRAPSLLLFLATL